MNFLLPSKMANSPNIQNESSKNQNEGSEIHNKPRTLIMKELYQRLLYQSI